MTFWAILILKSHVPFIINSNLIGCPVFLVAKSGNPTPRAIDSHPINTYGVNCYYVLGII